MLSQALRTAVADSDVRLRHVLAHATTQCRLEHLWHRMLPGKLQSSYERYSSLSRRRMRTSAPSDGHIAIIRLRRFVQVDNIVNFNHLSNCISPRLQECTNGDYREQRHQWTKRRKESPHTAAKAGVTMRSVRPAQC